MAENQEDKKDQGQQPPNVARKAKRVEVMVDNLGPELWKKGTVTDDPRAVALLDTANGRKLVREVK